LIRLPLRHHRISHRLTVPALRARKGGQKLVCLTAYTAPMAALLDPHCDLLLVGDSVGMVLHGLPSTVGVTLDMMILHGRAVMRGSTQALSRSTCRSAPTNVLPNRRSTRRRRCLDRPARRR